VDTDSFTGSARSAAAPLTLVAVGRLIKEKRFDRFISIVARLRAHFGLNVRGLIVGPDSGNENLRPKLENQARTLGLFPDFVQFRGGVSDVRSVYHESAVCVLTSDLEGTPNVLLEAMACGLPIVATQVGGVAEIVRHGQTGFLAQPNDLEGLAGFVADLLKNSQLRTEMGRRARSFVEENHSLEGLPALLARLYERVLCGARYAVAPVVNRDNYEVV
jgi:glycosyltransferase involved in cell wall biosynthesis